ncbi:efflux RND transporter periplasmic adaptor subunit [Flavobacterium sp. NRK F7]|uniref:efflux RND transporter periplasmic adaptor subunit n=1 Tax=Flavobacterium sp. NRK F7 TaxID=2954930 RepID=UPI002090018C|nr:efflux RND transporter periplasmic adaptor subunit [Flavobacterium sp. NRK F7]MCO6163262.1 efflux RND transporter periplasmic adaptor subunit [Flavobacterium sp. NRK F7]
MKLKTLLLTLLALSFVGLIAYRITSNATAQGDKKPNVSTKSVQTLNGFIVQENDFSNIISVSGSIDANEQVEIRSEVSGIVENIYFKEGAIVTKGQTLFKVNDIELRAQLAQAVTKRNLAAENERRAKLLLEKEAISQEEYDIASAEFRSLQSQTQLIQAQIAKTAIKAPFTGKIGLRNISPGTYLTPTTVVTNLVSAKEVKITFSIPEKYASEIKLNQTINFTVSGNTKIYNATVYAIEPSVDIATRTLLVRAKADNKNNELFPGTYANVKVPLNTIPNAILIPTEAIIPVQNGKKVFIKEKGKAKEVLVETGTRTESSILVTDGLKAGDTLITSGIMSLKSDTPVTIKVTN